MKPQKLILLTWMAFSMVMACSPLLAQVYKTVDEDGNVVYTDRPPENNAKPMDLPPLSIVETPDYQKTGREVALEGAADQRGADEEVPLKTLRRNYRDFAIISPLNEESVWHPDSPIPVAWSVSTPLASGMTVTLFVDGKKQAATTQPIIPIAGLDRGEHTLTAELKDATNRKIATTQPVTFFVKRPNIYTNRVRPRG